MKTLFVLLSLISSFAQADELSLMFIRSPEINWSSPRVLAKSTVSSMTKTYGLGHVNIRVACADRTILTGIYNRYIDETKSAVLKKGHGLGVLFDLFEGSIQQQKFIAPSFEKMSKEGRTNFITFKINPATCQRLLNYHDQYEELMNQRQAQVRVRGQKTHEQQIYYGFPALPRMGEGAGCSAFAISYLEVAGIKEQWMVDEWTQDLKVPQQTVGQPLQDKKVSLTSMVFSAPKKWATDSEPHYPLFFWDPDLMVDSTSAKLKTSQFTTATLLGAKGLVFDRRNVATPTEPIFFNNPFTRPTDPTVVYKDIPELLRRYEILKQISFKSEAPTSSQL